MLFSLHSWHIYRFKDAGPMYYCEHFPVCNSYVRAHGADTHQSLLPMGIVANKELRQVRSNVHKVFDEIWQINSRKKTYRNSKKPAREARQDAYKWLSSALGVPLDHCHIGNFGLNTCNQAIEVCNKKLQRVR